MRRRAGLGRGLDALLPSQGEAIEGVGPHEVPVESIEPNPRQPRRAFDDETMTDLAASIKELGILQPLLVRDLGDRYQLVAGERRLRASKLAGLERVPIMTVETDDRGSLERALVENLHREDLNPIEEAEGYRQLLDEADLTHQALAQRLGRNRVTITNSLRLLDLPDGVKKYLVEGRLSAAHGRALLGLQGNPFQARVAARAAQERLSVRETEALVHRYQHMNPTERRRSKRELPAAASEAQRRLTDYLQTRVRIEMGQRKGRIVLDFVSQEELERLTAVITGQQTGASSATVSPE